MKGRVKGMGGGGHLKYRKKFKYLWLSFFFCFSLGLFTGAAFPSALVRVTGVIDGDTIIISDGQRVRYLGIDTPERGKDGPDEFLAREAYEFNRDLVLKKEVRLVIGQEKQDRFERLLAYVFLGNGLFVNAELVKKGLAQVLYHGPWMERFDELLQLQREAIKNKRGIWTKALKESDDRYRGQIHTRRFHREVCPLGKGIAHKNLIILRSKKEAYWQGYSPCRSCKP
jgi:micrococcal nuclease